MCTLRSREGGFSRRRQPLSTLALDPHVCHHNFIICLHPQRPPLPMVGRRGASAGVLGKFFRALPGDRTDSYFAETPIAALAIRVHSIHHRCEYKSYLKNVA